MKRADSAKRTRTLTRRGLDIEEMRLVADLRIMHSKVDELYQVVANLKRRHSGADIHRYADQPLLNEDIARVDDMYGWFVTLKEEGKTRKATNIR